MNRIPIFVWFLAPTLIIVAIGAWFLTSNPMGDQNQDNPETLSAVSNPIAGTEEFTIAGREHIAEGTKSTNYNSNPPTSGSHWAAPANKGIYDQALPDERILHNLEHGYIWISYKPEISPEVINNIKNIVNEDDWKIVMAPRAENDSQINLAAWGRLLKMDEPDYQKIKDFIETYKNRGPEKTPD